MPIKNINLDIQNLKDGAVLERINHAIDCILSDINDVNKQPNAPREITVKLIFRADERREMIDCNVSVSPKIAPLIQIESKAVMGMDPHGFSYAREVQPMQQMSLDELIQKQEVEK